MSGKHLPTNYPAAKHSKYIIDNIRERQVNFLDRDESLRPRKLCLLKFHCKVFIPVKFIVPCIYQGIIVFTGMETRQIFSRMFVTLKKLESCFILLKME